MLNRGEIDFPALVAAQCLRKRRPDSLGGVSRACLNERRGLLLSE